MPTLTVKDRLINRQSRCIPFYGYSGGAIAYDFLFGDLIKIEYFMHPAINNLTSRRLASLWVLMMPSKPHPSNFGI